MKKHKEKRGMITYKVSKNAQDVLEFSKIALKAHLHKNGENWMLKDYLRDEMVKRIVIAYYGSIRKKPVGVAIVSLHNIVMTFVHDNYRLKGIGTNMLLKINLPKCPHLLDGIIGSKIFYSKAMKKIKG